MAASPVLAALLMVAIYASTSLTVILTAVLVLVCLLAGELRTFPALVRRYPVALWAGLLFALLCVGTLWSPVSFPVALDVVSKYRELLFLPFFLVLLGNTKSREYAWTALVLVTVLSLMLSFLMFLGVLEYEAEHGPSVKSRITHSVFVSFFLFYCVHRFMDGGRKQWLYGLLAAVSLVNLFFVVEGRTGQVAGLLLLALVAIQRLRLRAMLAMVSAVLVLGLCHFLYSDRTRDGVEDIGRFLRQEQVTADMSMGLRMLYWRNALQLILEKPLLGQGTGSFETRYAALVDDPALQTAHPHNEPLFIAAQLGLPGVLVYLCFMCALWRECRKLPEAERWLLQGVFFLIVITAMFNCPLLDHTEGHWFILLVALCIGASVAPEPCKSISG